VTHFGPIRILVADDEENLRILYKSELQAEGYEVLLAENARQAIDTARKEDLDLVVLDIRMPGMDGVETLQKILAQKRTLPVILNTAYSSYRDNYLTWAADAYVVKSADLGELKAKIREVLEKRGKDRGASSSA
jgi:DNA-binding response OmpR family regulator